MKRTCIFQDTERMENTAGLLEAARRLHRQGEFDAFLVLLDDPAEFGDNTFHTLFHHVIPVAKGLVDRWDARAITEILEKLHQKHRFDSILIPATSLGKMVAPRLAGRLETGLVPGVTDIKQHADAIEIIRPACSGKTVEGISVSGSDPVILGIRPNAFDYSPDSAPDHRMQSKVSVRLKRHCKSNRRMLC